VGNEALGTELEEKEKRGRVKERGEGWALNFREGNRSSGRGGSYAGHSSDRTKCETGAGAQQFRSNFQRGGIKRWKSIRDGDVV